MQKGSRKVRSLNLRSRIEDWLRLHDTRQTPVTRRDTQRDFVRRAIRVAENNGLRVWKDTTNPIVDVGVKSLRYLLGDYTQTANGTTWGGTNEGWVLDIWEAFLESYGRSYGKLFEGSEPKVTIEETKPFLEECTIQVVQDEVTVFTAPQLSLGMRIIEAFVTGDEDSIMTLALEVDGAR